MVFKYQQKEREKEIVHIWVPSERKTKMGRERKTKMGSLNTGLCFIMILIGFLCTVSILVCIYVQERTLASAVEKSSKETGKLLNICIFTIKIFL